MTTASVSAASAPWRESASRPPLRLIAGGPLVAGRLPFVVLVGGVLAVGLVALLLLHTLAAQDAFRLQALQHRLAALDDVEQQLALAEQERQAPAALAARARGLGMVPTGSIAFVRPGKHGRVVGVVQPAAAPAPPPAPAPTPSASAKADPKPAKADRASRDQHTQARQQTAHRRAAPSHDG